MILNVIKIYLCDPEISPKILFNFKIIQIKFYLILNYIDKF